MGLFPEDLDDNLNVRHIYTSGQDRTWPTSLQHYSTLQKLPLVLRLLIGPIAAFDGSLVILHPRTLCYLILDHSTFGFSSVKSISVSRVAIESRTNKSGQLLARFKGTKKVTFSLLWLL